ncbi:MAG: phenylacetyl-CoA:acceptor oxidoreductase [Xanthobacteraceae bacterium]|nr:MAG: phenylacetyl-CoA:acceptor oxidoreductase [Xanthobacteraceae bacterium]
MKQVVQARLQRYWDIRAAGNFSFGGTGSGLVLAAALALALGVASPWAVAVGLGFIGLGLFCVWLEIGKPWRAINVLFHPHTSWMTREALLVPPLMAAGAAAVLIDIRFVYLAALFAAGFMYCQARMLLASRGIPAWCQKEIVPLILATALAEGAGAFLVAGGRPQALIVVALVAGILREIARVLYRKGLVAAKLPAATLKWMASREEKGLTALRGLSLACLALALAGVAPTALAIAGGSLAVLAGWGLKAVIIVRAAFTRGQVISHTPTRGRGPTAIVIPS